MFKTETCIVAVCDLCQYSLDEECEGEQHYSTQTAATAAAKAQGWHHLTDGRLVCAADDGTHQVAIAADAAVRALM